MVFKLKREREKVPMYRIERLNEEKGMYWFSPDTKKFFKSKIPAEAYKKGNDAYFITSETNPSGETAFSIRKADLETGDIDTVGEFHSFKTKHDAEQELKKILEND